MVNESDIFNNFTKFFQDAERLIHKNKVSIGADGKLNVLGDVVVKLEYTTHQSTGLPFGKLPVQFGTVSVDNRQLACSCQSHWFSTRHQHL